VTESLRVAKGDILCYRVFDVGDEIMLDRAEEACRSLEARRAKIAEYMSESLAFAHPPVVVTLGKRTIDLPKTKLSVEGTMRARLFDYGAVSVLFAIEIAPGTELGELLPLCDELYDAMEVERVAREEADRVVEMLGKAIVRPHGWRVAETYTVLFLTETAPKLEGKELLAWPLLPKLLIGEPRDKPLSTEEAEDVLKHHHSYFQDDLAVIDWNSAVVLEPGGSRAIPDILELATSQLLELRYYDDVFDKELARIYDDLEEARRMSFVLLRDPYSRLAKAVLRRLVEMTEFAERVDNALKIIGDFYLARIYQSAVRRFRVGAWQASVDEKQRLVAQAYGFIKGELEARRSTLLELIVILLIAAELIAALRH
jgi:hypothetical protein